MDLNIGLRVYIFHKDKALKQKFACGMRNMDTNLRIDAKAMSGAKNHGKIHTRHHKTR